MNERKKARQKERFGAYRKILPHGLRSHYWPMVCFSDLSPTPQLGPNWPSMGQISSNTESLVGLEETAGTVWGLADPKWPTGNNSNAHTTLRIPLPQT